MSNQKPLITIVTVTINAQDTIEKTIQSVIQQTYLPLEYIVIDGGSTDKTINLLRHYESHISYWISEPDQGLYDAMNKAVHVAKGEWVCFMNAGDAFYCNTTVERIFALPFLDADIIYGSHYRVFPDQTDYEKLSSETKNELHHIQCNSGERYPAMLHKPKNLEDIWKGMAFSHQSMFVKSALIKKFNFNTRYKVAADFDFIFNRYMDQYKFYNAGNIISVISAGGLSGRRNLLRTMERWRIVRKRIKRIFIDLYYTLLILNFCYFSIKEWYRLFSKVNEPK